LYSPAMPITMQILYCATPSITFPSIHVDPTTAIRERVMLYETYKTNSPALHSTRIPKEKNHLRHSAKICTQNQKQASYSRPWTLPSKPKPNPLPLQKPRPPPRAASYHKSTHQRSKGERARKPPKHSSGSKKTIRLNVRPNQTPRRKEFVDGLRKCFRTEH
jgi:hypothetical protein